MEKAIVETLKMICKESISARRIPELQKNYQEAIQKGELDEAKEIRAEIDHIATMLPTKEHWEKSLEELEKIKL